VAYQFARDFAGRGGTAAPAAAAPAISDDVPGELDDA
jgi:hypothetical protein